MLVNLNQHLSNKEKYLVNNINKLINKYHN